MNLPDISDLEVFEYFRAILPLMIQLQIFSWNHSVSFPLSYLKYNTLIRMMSGMIETDCCAEFRVHEGGSIHQNKQRPKS